MTNEPDKSVLQKYNKKQKIRMKFGMRKSILEVNQ